MKLVAYLGPTGTAAVGILLVLGCVGWAVTRYRNPPILLTLKPGKSVKK